MAAGSGGQWETTTANGEGRWRPTVTGGSSDGNGLVTTGGGSRCRQTMQAMENDGGPPGGAAVANSDKH